MRIFDSSKNRKWIGTGFAAKENSLTVLKIAKFHQIVDLKPGEYTLRVVGKKKVGVGGIDVEIINKSEVVLNTFKVNFNSSAWSEQVFQFKINKDEGLCKIRVVRSPNSVGTIEITRISLDAKLDDIAIYVPSKGLPSSVIQEKKIDIISEEFINLDKTKSVKVSFIIPYGIYGGAEIYVKNLINNFTPNIKVNLLYLKENNLKNNITNPECKHFLLEGSIELVENIRENNYDFLIYYNRADVYNLLSAMKGQGDIEGKLIEIYHSDFIWPGSLSSVKERSNIYKLVTISPSLARNIKGVDNQNREVVPVGIDTRLFSKKDGTALKESLGLAGKKIIGTVARLSREKNIDGIIYTAKEMPEYHFAILGEGPERTRLEKLISDEKLHNITLLGHANDSYKYYNIFDAFLLLSSIEGTPISIIEAMASEVPVFTTEVGAINDLIKETITGFIVPNDPKVVAEKIRKNIENKEVLKAARMYVEKNFNFDINSEKFLDLFFEKVSFGRIAKKSPYPRGDVNSVRVIRKTDIKTFDNSDLVTVIINNYNKGQLLRKAVVSALNQKYYNIEVIVIDDNSSDNVGAILSGINDARLHIYLNKKNCGAYACRNFAIDNSKGKYITFLDSDDHITNDHILYLVGAVKRFNLKAINSKYKRVDGNNRTLLETRCEAAILFDREVLEDVGYFHMVRAAADSEYRERLTKYYGNNNIALLNYTSYVAVNVEDSLTLSKKTGHSSSARKDYVSKFRKNEELYYHYKNSMDFLNLHKDIISIPLEFNNFIKVK